MSDLASVLIWPYLVYIVDRVGNLLRVQFLSELFNFPHKYGYLPIFNPKGSNSTQHKFLHSFLVDLTNHGLLV